MIYYTQFRAMGCQVEVQLETKTDGQAILKALPAYFEGLENQLSRFRPDSELSHFNDQAGRWVEVSDVLFENLCASKQAARITDGLYNPLVLPALAASGYDRDFDQLGLPLAKPTLPIVNWTAIRIRPDSRSVFIPPDSGVDLGGIAKGWTAERLADELAKYGPCLVNIGGDITTRGAPDGYEGWQVAIADPGQSTPLMDVMLKDKAVVTSGTDYRRWQTSDGHLKHHVIDPRTGDCAQSDVLSVTIVHPHAPTAEAYAKAVLILGSQSGLEWLTQQWNAAGLVFRSDGAVLSTSNWQALEFERISI